MRSRALLAAARSLAATTRRHAVEGVRCASSPGIDAPRGALHRASAPTFVHRLTPNPTLFPPSRTESWRPWVTASRPAVYHRSDSWNRGGIATSAGAREAAQAAAEAATGENRPSGGSPSAPPTTEGITLTDACVARLRQLAAEDASTSVLRVAVDGGGCSGYQYTFSLDSTPAPRDKVFENSGAKVVVDEISFEFVKGSTVDYVEEMIRSSFAIADNPNAESGCGCGSSFVAK